MKEWNVGLMNHLGIRFVELGPDRVIAELDARGELATIGGADVLHRTELGRRQLPGGCSEGL